MRNFAIVLGIMLTQTSFAFGFCKLAIVNQALDITPQRTIVFFGDKNVTPIVKRSGAFKHLVLNVRLNADGSLWTPSTLEEAALAFVNYLPKSYLNQIMKFKSFDDVAINDSKGNVRERMSDIAYYIDQNWAASLSYRKDYSLADDILQFLSSLDDTAGWRCKKTSKVE